jgi:hypothetical protein
LSAWICWYMALNVLGKSLNLTLSDIYEPWLGKSRVILSKVQLSDCTGILQNLIKDNVPLARTFIMSPLRLALSFANFRVKSVRISLQTGLKKKLQRYAYRIYY